MVTAAVAWADLEPAIDALMHKHHKNKRVVRVFAPCVGAPALYQGMFGGAPVESAPTPSIQWNTGEIEPVDLS